MAIMQKQGLGAGILAPAAFSSGTDPRLSLARARELVSAALERPRTEHEKAMAIVVLDDAGHVLISVREDGASALRLDIATGKAAAAIGMGVNSRVLAERAQALPTFFGAIAATARQPFIPQTGAVLVKTDSGVTLGAVGASGGTGDEDERLCIAAVQAIGLCHG